MMNTRRLQRVVLLAVLVVPLASTLASAQYRIDNSSARDANNRLGSGGYNDASAGGRIGGLAGNYIVTGNVTNGRSFRGALGYTDQSSFRGSLGSASFDNFVRDSTGVGQIRGDYSRSTYSGTTVQPYFGAGRTVAPPAGFVPSSALNGGYVPRPPTAIEPNDGRVDYGGATNQQVTQGLLGGQRFVGGAGLATTSGQQWSEATPQTRPLQLSEFTQLARQSRTNVFGGALSAGNEASSDPTVSALNNANGVTPNGMNAPLANRRSPDDAGSDPAAQPGRGPADQRLNGTPNNAAVDDAARKDRRLDSTGVITPGQLKPGDQKSGDANDASDAAPQNPGSTGQISTIRSLRAIDNNPQYAELRNRLTANKPKQLPGAEANAQIQEVNAQLVKQRAGGEVAAKDARPGAAPRRVDGTVTLEGAQTGEGSTITSTKADDGAKPRDGEKTNSTADAKIGAEPAAPTDTLKLPRPSDDATGDAMGRDARTAMPMLIHSFANGVKDKELARTLREAEDLMKAGKFGSAMESYDRAGVMANDDPLVFLGRSIAELGGSYYRKSELHLRQAFVGDPALLGAKFDLRGLLTDARLNFLTNDLGEVARTNPNDPGPILLLAFIYYNGNMEARAARALDIAEQRAGGKDPVIKLLKENWTLNSAAETNK